MTIEAIAQALGLAESTVKLDWQKARAWLYRELKET
jgi:DNA-directed RNA polymerase specialized sigma24 family protein